MLSGYSGGESLYCCERVLTRGSETIDLPIGFPFTIPFLGLLVEDTFRYMAVPPPRVWTCAFHKPAEPRRTCQQHSKRPQALYTLPR